MTTQVDEKSIAGFKSELDLFSLPPTQVAVDKGYWAEYYPQNPVTNSAPYRLCIPKDSFMFDLNKNYLYLRLKTSKSDGTDIALAHDGSFPVAATNQLCTNFCGRLILKLSDKEIENCPLYAYKAYIDTLLNYSAEAKRTHLQLGLYEKDDTGQFNSLDAPAMKKRGQPFCKNKGV